MCLHHLQHSVDARTVIKADKDKDCHKIAKSKPENLEDIETSGGPVGEVISFLFELLLNDFFAGP